MIFKTISVKRNYHISNTDQYMKEELSSSADLEDGEDEQLAINKVRERLNANHRSAYPNVDRSLNFDEEIQIRVPFSYTNAPVEPIPVVPVIAVQKSKDEEYKDSLRDLMDSKDIDELETFEAWAKSNNAGKTYDELFKKLSK